MRTRSADAGRLGPGHAALLFIMNGMVIDIAELPIVRKNGIIRKPSRRKKLARGGN